MKKRITLLAFLLVVSLFVVACGGGGQTGNGGGGSANPNTDPGAVAGTKVLRIAHMQDPITLNSVRTTNAGIQSVYGHVSEQLVYFSHDGSEIVPGLATDWGWLDDVTFELKLREGVTFTNGEPMDAVAVKFSLEQYFESSFYANILPSDGYEFIDAIDETTVHVKLNKPFAPFVSALARSISVVPPVYYAEVGAEGFGEKPVGTGPFVLTEWVKDSHITMDRNEDYWGDPLPLDQLVFKVIPEETARVAALQRGEVDLVLTYPLSGIDQLDGSSASVVKAPGLRKNAVFFDTLFMDSPVDNVLVRQALNYAVDKETIVEVVYSGAADVLQGQWQTPSELGFNPDLQAFPYDPERARELLAEAGYPNGFDLQLSYNVASYKELAEIMAGYFADVGIRVEQRPLEYGAVIENLNNHTLGTNVWGFLLPLDPHFNYGSFARGAMTSFRDMGDEFEAILAEAASTVDVEKRDDLYQQLAQMMYDDASMLYLMVPQDLYGVANRVQGFQPRIDQVLRVTSIDVTN